MTASIPNQAPNTEKAKRNASQFNMTTQNVHISGLGPFFKLLNNS